MVRLNSRPGTVFLAVDDYSDADRLGSAPSPVYRLFYTHEEDVKKWLNSCVAQRPVYADLVAVVDFTCAFKGARDVRYNMGVDAGHGLRGGGLIPWASCWDESDWRLVRDGARLAVRGAVLFPHGEGPLAVEISGVKVYRRKAEPFARLNAIFCAK